MEPREDRTRETVEEKEKREREEKIEVLQAKVDRLHETMGAAGRRRIRELESVTFTDVKSFAPFPWVEVNARDRDGNSFTNDVLVVAQLDNGEWKGTGHTARIEDDAIVLEGLAYAERDGVRMIAVDDETKIYIQAVGVSADGPHRFEIVYDDD